MGLGEGAGIGQAYLEGTLVGKSVGAGGTPARFAKEQQVLKEENAAQRLVASTAHRELILPHQLALLLKVNLPSAGQEQS